MKHVPRITVLLLCLAMGLSGCEQARDLAMEAAETAKQAAVSEVSKAVNNGEQETKKDAGSSKDLDREKDEEK